MRNYKKEYQKRINNKKEIRFFIDLKDYEVLKQQLKSRNLSPSQYCKLNILYDINIRNKILKLIDTLYSKINEETGLFYNNIDIYEYCIQILTNLLEIKE